jgi:hypothetical protein
MRLTFGKESQHRAHHGMARRQLACPLHHETQHVAGQTREHALLLSPPQPQHALLRPLGHLPRQTLSQQLFRVPRWSPRSHLGRRLVNSLGRSQLHCLSFRVVPKAASRAEATASSLCKGIARLALVVSRLHCWRSGRLWLRRLKSAQQRVALGLHLCQARLERLYTLSQRRCVVHNTESPSSLFEFQGALAVTPTPDTIAVPYPTRHALTTRGRSRPPRQTVR